MSSQQYQILLSTREAGDMYGRPYVQFKNQNQLQGLIGMYVEGNSGTMVELNCETDFVAKNSKFHSLLNEIVAAKFHHLKGSPQSTEDISIQVTTL